MSTRIRTFLKPHIFFIRIRVDGALFVFLLHSILYPLEKQLHVKSYFYQVSSSS